MKRFYLLLLFPAILASGSVRAEQADDFDYFQHNRELIRNGVQAVLQCNGLFTSRRSLKQVFEQELAYLRPDRFGGVVGTAGGGEYSVDEQRKAVTVGGPAAGTPVSAIFREGIGCVVLPPDQSPEDTDALPRLKLPYPDFNPAEIPWPDGDLVTVAAHPEAIDQDALLAASEWAFVRDTQEQDTLSLIVLYKGDIVHERYAPGFDQATRTRTWSTAKSIAVTLIGMLVDSGELILDAPLGIEWGPDLLAPEADPHREITLRHLLNMSSGLYPVDSFNMEYATGSGLAYWAGASSTGGMRDRGLDYGGQGFDQWDLTREVLKAFADPP